MTLYDIALSHGEGAVIIDVDGNHYLDCLAGASANVLGHGRSELVAAYAEQAGALQHSCYAYSPTTPALDLADLLISTVSAAAGPYQVVLGLSGSDVNGATVEIARRATGRRGILKFDWAYHGTTGLSQPASGFSRLNQQIYPDSAEFIEIPFPSSDSGVRSLELMERALRENEIACVLIETIQGDGGVRIPPSGFVRSARALAREHGAIFVADEVQSGMGRTGRLWCYEHFLPEDDPPDLITIGKGLAAGYAPIAAVLGRTRFIDALSFGQQTLTFAGHPPSCAVAARCLGLMRSGDGPVQNADRRGEQLRSGLQPLCNGRPIKDVRGKGLMIGVEIDLEGDPLRCKAFAFALVRHGIYAGIVGGAQNVIRLSPPLILTASQVEQIVAVFGLVAGEFRDGTPDHYATAAKKHSIGL